MKNLKSIIQVLAFVLITSVTTTAHAGEPTGLFVNLTTNDTKAANKAIMFAHKIALKRGYSPVAIWLNVNGIHLADKMSAPPALKAKLISFMKDGGTVIACRMCSKAAGITKKDLIKGIKMGNADMVTGILFNPNVKTLSW